ncbi:MAG: CehA/McbA family metallohydrolase [Polyangia bacterium]
MTERENTGESWLIDEPGYGRGPRICSDRAGRWWAAWIGWDENGERVRVCRRDPGRDWTGGFEAVSLSPAVTSMSIAAGREGLLVAWTDGGGLWLRQLDADGGGPRARRLVEAAGAPREACLAAGESGALLAWTEIVSGSRRARALTLDRGAPSGEPWTASGQGEIHGSPAAAVGEGSAWIAWQVERGPLLAVRCRRIDDSAAEELEPVAVASGGTVALPALCSDGEGGAWIAWQSDVDPDEGPVLVRWIELAHVDPKGRAALPTREMPGVARRGEGVDQGFESPALALAPSGRLVLVGRSSQGLWRQDLGAAGWSERRRLDEEGWACRGRRPSVCGAGEDLLVAARERAGIVVRQLDLSPTGAGEDRPLLLEREPLLASGEGRRSSSPPRREIDGRRILFGDIHQHTAASDGTGTHAETYHRARYRYDDDIAAVSDHESFLGKRTPPGEWIETCRAADERTVSGAFVALHAYEWTGRMHPGPGHKVVYPPAQGGPVLSRDDEASAESSALLRRARESGALVFPHHVGWTGADAANHDPQVQSCWEIVSCHGAYERPGVGPIATRGDDKPGQFVAEMLDAGLRFGLVGGSDGHGLDWQHGICRVRDSHRTGLTAVLCERATREAVLDALRARRCYATSGAKILLWLEAAGAPMGSEIRAPAGARFRALAEGTAPLSSAALVTGGGRELVLEISGRELRAAGSLPPPPADPGWSYWYLRVVQSDDQVAWSSPIWLEGER